MMQKKPDCRFFVRKHEGSSQLGKSRRKWKGNIKMNLKEIVWDVMGWINACQFRDSLWVLVNMALKFRVP